MSRATSSLPRTIGAHAALLLYTAIALFPVVVIVINSFKSRNAIFRTPLSPPTPETFEGQTVVKREILPDGRHRLIVKDPTSGDFADRIVSGS